MKYFPWKKEEKVCTQIFPTMSSTKGSQGKERASPHPSPSRARPTLGREEELATPSVERQLLKLLAAPPPFTGGPCSVGCPRLTQRLSPLWSLLTTTSKSLPHQQPVPEAHLLHLGGAEQASPSRPQQPPALGGKLARKHQAEDVTWPGQEREAGPGVLELLKVRGVAKTPPQRLKASDHLSS